MKKIFFAAHVALVLFFIGCLFYDTIVYGPAENIICEWPEPSDMQEFERAVCDILRKNKNSVSGDHEKIVCDWNEQELSRSSGHISSEYKPECRIVPTY